MKTNKLKVLIMMVPGLLFMGCTDLEIEESDSIIANQEGEFTGVTDVASALDNVYNAVRGQLEAQENLYALNTVTTDELLVPTRGTDWGDNGLWRTLHQHSWSPIHPFILNTWNQMNSNVFNTTEIIDPLSSPSAQQEAEARFLRAFSMFWIVDLYGQVPFRGPTEGPEVDPVVFTRAEAVDFIVNDLNFAVSNLPAVGPGMETNRANKAAAHYLLAKVLLNKHIYNGTEANSADMNEVVANVDAINSLGFDLQAGYFELFTESVDTETVFFTTSGVGNKMWNGLHYFQGAPGNEGGGWNGFSTLAEFYDLFEGDPNINVPGSGQEERRGFVPTDGSHFGIGYGFLINQQYDENGDPLMDRTGNPLRYTKEYPGLLGNDERTGIRVIKWHPENGAFNNHHVIFRYGDAHLMKAEAIMRGGSGGDALEMVNELRTLRDASPLASLSEQDMIDERGRELYIEFWRRNDLIRFGRFTESWEMKENTEEFRVLFPIPSGAILSNPNLTQNPGY